MGPHWRRPGETWKLAQLPGFYQTGSVKNSYSTRSSRALIIPVVGQVIGRKINVYDFPNPRQS